MEPILKTLSALQSLKVSDILEGYQTLKTHVYNACHPFTHPYEQQYQMLTRTYNLDSFDQLALLFIILLVLYKLIQLSLSTYAFILRVKERGIKASLFNFAVTYIPFAKNKLETDLKKTEAEFYQYCCKNTEKRCPKLPAKGMKSAALQKRVLEWAERDEKISGTGKISGSRYCSDIEFENEVKEFTKEFMYHNPLHYEIFPATRQMEAEIVRMTGNMFGTDDGFGYTTTGGTESILMGVLAHRNYAAKYRNITKPNLVLPLTAHPAFIKACKFFQIEFRRAKVDENSEVILSDVKKRIDSNTIMLVGSVPNYPHGAIDNIPELAKLALASGVGLHVDCCLGGFVVAFAKDYGLNIPPFDFNVKGVTSISCDQHKYALAPKGISTILFKTNLLRSMSYTSVSDWPGGFYATPSVCGSKAGGPIAGAWYAMMYNGREGYVEKSKIITGAVQQIAKAFNELPELSELQTIGHPKLCSLAIVYRKGVNKNIYHLEGALSALGWKFSGVQLPPAIQVSINHGIAGKVKELIRDLKICAKDVAENPEKYKNSSSASMYGASVKVPDIQTLDRVLDIVIDSFLKL